MSVCGVCVCGGVKLQGLILPYCVVLEIEFVSSELVPSSFTHCASPNFRF